MGFARNPAEAKSVFFNQFRQQLSIGMARSLSRLMFDRLNYVVYGPNREDAARHATLALGQPLMRKRSGTILVMVRMCVGLASRRHVVK